MLRQLPARVFLTALAIFFAQPAGAAARKAPSPAATTKAPATHAAAPESLASHPAGPPEPRLFLTWNGLPGSPRATNAIHFTCGSMTRLDTLILSFDPGQNSDSFTGFTAALWVQPMLASDTLSSIWDGPSESALPMWMKYQSGPDSVINTPFQAGGAGGAACHHTPDGGRVIRMVQAVAYADSTPVEAGKIYGLARFIIRQPAMSPGCMQPVCIEFRSSVLSTIGGRHRPVEATGVGVSLNAPAGKQCFEPTVPASSAAKPK